MSSSTTTYSGALSSPDCPICMADYSYEHIPIRFSGCSHRICNQCTLALLETEEAALGVPGVLRCSVCRSYEDRRNMVQDWEFLGTLVRCSECCSSLSHNHFVCTHEGCTRINRPFCSNCASTSHAGDHCKTSEVYRTKMREDSSVQTHRAQTTRDAELMRATQRVLELNRQLDRILREHNAN